MVQEGYFLLLLQQSMKFCRKQPSALFDGYNNGFGQVYIMVLQDRNLYDYREAEAQVAYRPYFRAKSSFIKTDYRHTVSNLYKI